jgi:branched-chain amino acid transport system substrate-binding protein
METTPMNRPKSRRFPAFAALLIVSLFSLASPTSSRQQAFAEEADPIKVGVYLSLTGSTATFGQTTREGIELAVKQQNEKGGFKGRKIQLIVYDNEGKTQETGTVVTRLIQSDKVVAVLGEVASTQSIAAGRICQLYGVPMISPSSTNPQVTQIGDMVFRVCFIDPDQGYGGAKFAVDHIHAKTAAILFDQKQAYSTGLGKNFEEAFAKLGGKVTTKQAYSSGTTDFSAQLNTIKEGNPDVLYVPGYYTEVGTVAKQARQKGIKAPLLGGDGWESEQLHKIGGEAIEGSFYSNHYAPESTDPASVAYQKEYKAEYGHPSSALAALGYDSAKLLFDAMGRAASLKGKDLAAAIAATNGDKSYHGATGAISIDAKRNVRKPMVIIEVTAQGDKYVTTIDPPKD